MVKTIIIAGKQVRLRATASVPRLYRAKFQRDIFEDITKILKDVKKKNTDVKNINDLTVMENIVYIMAKHGDVDENGQVIGAVPNTVEEWLDSFDGVFSIYNAFQDSLELWGTNINSIAHSKKKRGKLRGR